MFYCEFYQIFRTLFFAKHLRVTASAKYPFSLVTSTSATNYVSFDLRYFKYFRDKHWVAWEQRFEQLICQKCCWKPEAAAQLSSVKMRFCKTLQRTSKKESLFCKTVNLKPATVLKRTLSLVFSCEYIYVNTFFSFFTLFQKISIFV